MFGRQQDITTRDQRAPIDVPLPDDAIAAITASDDASAPVANQSFMDTPLMQDDVSLDGHLDAIEAKPAPQPQAAPLLPQAAPRTVSVQQPPKRLTTNDLLDLKHAALTELSPIIDVLDAKPEDKFRTLIELIQSTDNQSLLPSALAIAKTIEDKQVRAQALLTIVNEANYFTKHNAGQ
jgi:hypothetical protein